MVQQRIDDRYLTSRGEPPTSPWLAPCGDAWALMWGVETLGIITADHVAALRRGEAVTVEPQA